MYPIAYHCLILMNSIDKYYTFDHLTLYYTTRLQLLLKAPANNDYVRDRCVYWSKILKFFLEKKLIYHDVQMTELF